MCLLMSTCASPWLSGPPGDVVSACGGPNPLIPRSWNPECRGLVKLASVWATEPAPALWHQPVEMAQLRVLAAWDAVPRRHSGLSPRSRSSVARRAAGAASAWPSASRAAAPLLQALPLARNLSPAYPAPLLPVLMAVALLLQYSVAAAHDTQPHDAEHAPRRALLDQLVETACSQT